jgi:hypothetical protein
MAQGMLVGVEGLVVVVRETQQTRQLVLRF